MITRTQKIWTVDNIPDLLREVDKHNKEGWLVHSITRLWEGNTNFLVIFEREQMVKSPF